MQGFPLHCFDAAKAGIYTIYEGMSLPDDARSDGAGTVWYAEGPDNHLGQLLTDSGTLTLWEVPAPDGLYGTEIDASGNVWATGFFDPLLFRFDPASQQLCSYSIPATFPSKYLAADAQGIWLAEGNGDYIFHLDPALNEVTQWTLPAAGWPFGLDIDPESNLWWADYGLGMVNRLEPEVNRLTAFAPPMASNPVMLDASTDEVWFTDDVNSIVGGLRPDAVEGVSTTLTAGTVPIEPTCTVIEPAATTPVTVTTELISFTQTSYPLAVDGEGWTVLSVPDMGAPYGIRATERSAWMVDYDRRVLSWLLFGSSVTACKLEDADGDLGTPEDQTPVPAWRMYLTVDGVRQEPGELTRSAGCYTWLDLEPGHTYGVEEAAQVGWDALTPESHDFGVSLAGERYEHTFVNARGGTIQVFLPLVLRSQGAGSRQPGD
jgi:streptogramin lyase